MLNSLVGEHMEGQDLHAPSNKSRTEPLFLLVLLSCSLYNTLMTAGELFSLGFRSQVPTWDAQAVSAVGVVLRDRALSLGGLHWPQRASELS